MAESKYKLTYFNVKGLGEMIRLMFAYADVDFEDNRISKDDWPALKEKTPYGTLPILDVDGKVLNQSAVICRFLGKRFGLVNEDPFTDALLEAVVDNLKDVQSKLKNAMVLKTPESQKESADAIKYVLDRFELVATEGYFYGPKPSWVDIYFTGLFETLADYIPEPLKDYPNLLALTNKIKSKDGVQKYIKNRPAYDPPAH